MHAAELLNTLLKTAAAPVLPAFLPRRIRFGLDGNRHPGWIQATDPKAGSAPEHPSLQVIKT